MNDDNEDWWGDEDYWIGSKYEYERNFILWLGHWLVEWWIVSLFLTEAILYTFRFLTKNL